jgi:uncharacterized protein YjbI with pentapeptide repeats
MDRRDVAKRTAILIASCILILILFVYIPTVSANVQDELTAHAYLTTTTSIQGTPTVDPILTALQKKKLAQEIDQRQHNFQNWFWNLITASFSTLALVAGGLFAFVRWLRDRQDVRKQQAEERFKSVVDGLGGETIEIKIASAVLLRTFLRPEYKEYYMQVFDLAVANLRISEHAYSSTTKSSNLSTQILQVLLNNTIKKQAKNPTEEIQEPDKAKSSEAPHYSLRQALIIAFREAFPFARSRLKKQNALQRRFISILKNLSCGRRTILIRLVEVEKTLKFKPEHLDASNIQLDNAFLFGADLRQAYMPKASLEKADLSAARLSEINLQGANLKDANLDEVTLTRAFLEESILEYAKLTSATLNSARLRKADLTGATLKGANLSEADLTKTNLSGTTLTKANLSGTTLTEANLSGATLTEANLIGADLTKANLSGTTLTEANLSGATLTEANLIGADLTNANLSDTDLRRAKYNVRPISKKDEKEMLMPTRWPQAFNFDAKGVICVDWENRLPDI